MNNIKNYISNVIEGAEIQMNVVRALYYRELLTRINKTLFGFLGLFIKPFANIFILLMLFGIRRGFAPILEIDLVLFIGIGIIIYSIFREISIRSLNSIKANQALFTYKRVKAIDTVIARTIVEMLCLGIVYIVIIIGYSIIRETWFIVDLPLILFSYLSITILSFSLGLIFMVSGFRYPIIEEGLPYLLRPLYFCSGVFFSLQNLPQWLKPWLSWNPILQAIEISRKGFSENYYLDPLISKDYLILCVILSLIMGLYIYQKNERLLT